MARVPELVQFAKQHNIKLGTIADLIRHRSRHERLVELEGQRSLTTAHGQFTVRAYRDKFGGAHLVLIAGAWAADDIVPVRVHEPLSVLDLLDAEEQGHSWPLPLALRAIQSEGRGAVLLLNVGAETAGDLLARVVGKEDPGRAVTTLQEAELRTYGVGAQILRDLKISRMKILGHQRRFPSLGGYDLQVEDFVPPQAFR